MHSTAMFHETQRGYTESTQLIPKIHLYASDALCSFWPLSMATNFPVTPSPNRIELFNIASYQSHQHVHFQLFVIVEVLCEISVSQSPTATSLWIQCYSYPTQQNIKKTNGFHFFSFKKVNAIFISEWLCYEQNEILFI